VNCRFDALSSLAPFELFFLCMPFEHSESTSDQDLGVSLNRQLLAAAKERNDHAGPTVAYFEDAVENKASRAELVRTFGRYPPRNEALGRASTTAELALGVIVN
jgi:uncharacterized protein (DUF924 family)